MLSYERPITVSQDAMVLLQSRSSREWAIAVELYSDPGALRIVPISVIKAFGYRGCCITGMLKSAH